MMTKNNPRIGLIGLGTMGRNLALNIADNNFQIAVFNRTTERTREFFENAGALQERLVPGETLEEFVESIGKPRSIILMLPAGEVVDQQIKALRALLDPQDLIIDAGNANFHDTTRRSREAGTKGEMFMGIGVSGGEEGARFGPAIMAGGPEPAWQRVCDILQAIAADYEGEPCATWMGPEGAGHYVKMVHNGIEYADMQMISEVYGIMRDGMAMTAPEIAETFKHWNKGQLKSYLIEISGEVAAVTDDETGKPILDIILDRAGQKGTGRWTAIEALHRATPVTAIDAAVAARSFSSRLDERMKGEALFGAAPKKLGEGVLTLDVLAAALLAGKIACYAQGFSMLSAASQHYEWALPLPDIARNWREGCIIRSALLNDMASALEETNDENLLFQPFFADIMRNNHPALRKVVGVAAEYGLPAPALSAGLSYFDMMRTGRSTANMIQAQRDFFGAHSFERVDKEGSFHGPWNGIDEREA